MATRIRSLARAGALVAVAGVAACAWLVAASPELGRAVTAAEPARQSLSCPEDVLKLTPDAPAPATVAALAEAAEHYPAADVKGVRANAAARAASAGARGRMVRRMCGKRVAHRTVVVELLFPELLPSASLSQGAVFVSRFADGYHVWLVAH